MHEQQARDAATYIQAQADAEFLGNVDCDLDTARAASSVVDLDADETSCPACGATIPGGVTRCPECLLAFG